jgi:60 kDa SS-A/Ro ribonucleoprotein
MDRKAETFATYAMTGVLRGTFTAGAREDVGLLGGLASAVSAELVAKTAVVARAHGRSKTLPAVLVATLAARDVSMMERVFARVIDDGPSLLTFCDAVRSGSLGRKSFGSAPRRALRDWFSSRSPEAIFRQSIGRSPSMSDVIKMIRPAPRVKTGGNGHGESDAAREALYGYLVGKNVDCSLLPPLARALESFKRLDGPKGPVPDLPLEMLTALPLRTPHWTELAAKMTFSQLRQHLSTLLRHGVLADPRMAESVAERLSDPRAIARAKAKPYALYTILRAVKAHAPHVIVRALEDAIELALGNVPAIEGGVTVMVDGSGSMLGPLAGARRSSSGALRCIDVAGLVADAYRSMTGEALTIAVSDYEATTMNANVLVDVQPKRETRVEERDDVLYVAGFSDDVFDVIAAFARGELDGARWLALIEDTTI